VKIWYRGSGGTVCDDDFDDKDATVICRMLGYRYIFLDYITGFLQEAQRLSKCVLCKNGAEA
jgi:hypothetical protein